MFIRIVSMRNGLMEKRVFNFIEFLNFSDERTANVTNLLSLVAKTIIGIAYTTYAVVELAINTMFPVEKSLKDKIVLVSVTLTLARTVGRMLRW